MLKDTIFDIQHIERKIDYYWKKIWMGWKMYTKKAKSTILNNTKTNKEKAKIMDKETQIKEKTANTCRVFHKWTKWFEHKIKIC